MSNHIVIRVSTEDNIFLKHNQMYRLSIVSNNLLQKQLTWQVFTLSLHLFKCCGSFFFFSTND